MQYVSAKAGLTPIVGMVRLVFCRRQLAACCTQSMSELVHQRAQDDEAAFFAECDALADMLDEDSALPLDDSLLEPEKPTR